MKSYRNLFNNYFESTQNKLENMNITSNFEQMCPISVQKTYIVIPLSKQCLYMIIFSFLRSVYFEILTLSLWFYVIVSGDDVI